MTTPEAEAYYRQQHNTRTRDSKVVVHNPHDKPEEELPIIFAFVNGGSPRWLNAVALSEDGYVLAGHICSHEDYVAHDLGVIECGFDRHNAYREHYPDGYRMQFVSQEEIDTKTNERLMQAIARANLRVAEQALGEPSNSS